MENIEIPPFYVGQEVVANITHSQKAYKKGDEFKVQSVFKGCCKWEITIGITPPNKEAYCRFCNKTIETNDGEWSFYAFRFSPKIEIKEFVSMKQLADKQLELISAN